MKKRRTEKMHVTDDFFKFVRTKKAENPQKFKTNYDVLDHLIGKENKERKIEPKKNFWGRI